MAREIPCYEMEFDQSGEIVPELEDLVQATPYQGMERMSEADPPLMSPGSCAPGTGCGRIAPPCSEALTWNSPSAATTIVSIAVSTSRRRCQGQAAGTRHRRGQRNPDRGRRLGRPVGALHRRRAASAGRFCRPYLFARRLGLKVLLFTNARLITPELADLFARIPPLGENRGHAFTA